VWWILAVNLLLAWLGSLAVRATLSTVLDHSLESAKLVTGFDLSTWTLLIERPEVQLRSVATSAAGALLVFVLYLLFIDGGVYSVYLEDRKLSRGEFFEAAGLFFWRMVRLALYSILPFGLLIAADTAVTGYVEKLSNDAPQGWLGIVLNVASKIVFLLVALWVRLWFDLAQARVVRDNERKVLWTLLRSLKAAFTSGLYSKYLGIAVFAAVTFAAGAGVWFYLPHRAMGASFVVLELVTVTQIASRLWMKAASARWIALLPAVQVTGFAPAMEAPVGAPFVEPSGVEPPVSE
jgi:uncharacterized membrane protein (Fun14 family)